MRTILLVLFSSIYLAGRSVEGIFGEIKYTCNLDTEELDNRLREINPSNAEVSSEVVSNLLVAHERANNFNFKLIFNDSISYSYLIESVEDEPLVSKLVVRTAKVIVRGNQVNYKNLVSKEKKYETTLDNGKNYFQVVEPFSKYNWIITNGAKTVKGYPCQKATCLHT